MRRYACLVGFWLLLYPPGNLFYRREPHIALCSEISTYRVCVYACMYVCKEVREAQNLISFLNEKRVIGRVLLLPSNATSAVIESPTDLTCLINVLTNNNRSRGFVDFFSYADKYFCHS